MSSNEKSNQIQENSQDSIFDEMSLDELYKILSQTIKRDKANALITFLGMLSAFTEDSQLNISFNAPSSSGKSFIANEISAYFPEESVIKLGGASPTAFYHEQGEYNKDKNQILVDLSRKILVFQDQPNSGLLEKLRPVLSKDDKEIYYKITDKNQVGGNKTKTVAIRGYPAVVFCSAGLHMDAQEVTRVVLLSPDIDAVKQKEAVLEKVKRLADTENYNKDLKDNPDRQRLIKRVDAIAKEGIRFIRLGNSQLVADMFLERVPVPRSRHARTIAKIVWISKAIAALNVWNRERINGSPIASKSDIKEAFNLWDQVSEAQELCIPPYALNVYKNVIKTLSDKKNSVHRCGVDIPVGITRMEISQEHYNVFGSYLTEWNLRTQVLPILETASLIIQDDDPTDKKRRLVYLASTYKFSKDDESLDKPLTKDEVKDLVEGIDGTLGL